MTTPSSLPITRGLCAALLVGALVLGGPVAAQEPDDPATDDRTPEELAAEGLDNLMRALELMLLSIPQYEMPEINERGDIIIRRKNPPKDAPQDTPEQAPGNEGQDGDPEATET